MARELSTILNEVVNEIATKKVVTEYTRPWINGELSSQLKHLRKLRRKCRLRKSPRNIFELNKVQQKTVDMIKKAENDWWLSECDKLSLASDSEKWRIIGRLTNQSGHQSVQPIRKTIDGNSIFLFSDEDIRKVMEDYYIRKVHHDGNEDTQTEEDHTLCAFNHGNDEAINLSLESEMNSDVTDQEVKLTFSIGTNAAGPDEISASMIDKADREPLAMHRCLKILWNRAWMSGIFIKQWKEENRIVIPKVGRDDYHECSSYHTISITTALGKRFEYITAQRLVSVLTVLKFDFEQHAYVKDRSATQAILSLVEVIKKGILQGQCAGVVFFDFTDAFESVNRTRLLHKIRNHFNISGRLFSHISSFLSDRVARLKLDDSMGDWIESIFGTSAGTRLGPLLFIMHIHD